jgi:hypothetical protein
MNHTITILEGECDLTDVAAPEYDFAEMHRIAKEQGREYRGMLSGQLVRLAPDVSEIFNTSEAVNEALRTLIRVMRQEMKSAA